jgi:hypothetical protein
MLRFGAHSDCHDNGVALSDDDPVRRGLALLGIAVATLGSGVAAPPVHADPSLDASFLDSLTKAGITVKDGPGAVKAGKTACGLMQQGKPELDVIQLVTRQNPGLDTTRAAQFTAIAASAYCPQYLQRASDNGSGEPQPTPQPNATTQPATR